MVTSTTLAYRELLLEMSAGPHVRDAEDLRALALSLLGHAPHDATFALDAAPPRPGDILVRAAPAQGVHYVAVVLSEAPETAKALAGRGVDVEPRGPGLYVEVAEVPAPGGGVRTRGRRVHDAWGRTPPGQRVYRPLGEGVATFAAESFAEGGGGADDDDPLASWVPDTDSLVYLIADKKLYVLPASALATITPSATDTGIEWGKIIEANDLGPLLGLPPVGAGASRVFRAGPRLGVMLDAGRNPKRQPAAVYLPHLAARVRDLGLSEVRAVILIHRHADHANEVANVVQQYGITAANVIVPRAFQTQQADQTYTANLRALQARFGATWQPADLRLRPATAAGDLVRGRYTLGDTSFEFLGITAALKLPKHSDSASLLVRVTRQGEGQASVVLGDLRGRDLEEFHRLMGAPAWADFFRNVRLVDGFSHHRGALEAADVPGIMRLLEATLLRRGTLTATIQTDPGDHAQARADTLEFMRRVGITVVETHVGTVTPSGVRATSGTATATGPSAATHQPIDSELVRALGRVARLAEARETVTLWASQITRDGRPIDQKTEIERIDRSLEQLRSAARDAVEAAANVRGARVTGQAGPRDYSGGRLGTAYAGALGAIPTATDAETSIGESGFGALRRLREIPAAEVPLVVKLNDALQNGKYDRDAFRYMLSQIEPSTRRSLLTGPRGGPSGKLAAFDRVRAQYWTQSQLGSFDVMSASHLSPTGRVGARGVAGVLLLVEVGNLVAQGVQSYRISQATARNRNIVPFLRRTAFWRKLRVHAAEVAVDDGLTSTDYERDVAKIDKGLLADDWDFLYIEHTDKRPALTDADILRIMAVLGYQIRNYDEYATLFEDSYQDAIRYDTRGGTWVKARWEVCVGDFETSGTNHVVERWVELPALTEGMRALTRRVVANTNELLARVGRGETADTVDLGTITGPNGFPLQGKPLYRARLAKGKTKTRIELRPNVPTGWNTPPDSMKPFNYFHEVEWQRGAGWKTGAAPEFYVWEQPNAFDVRVTGADFATYAALRDLDTWEYQVGTSGSNLNTVTRRKVRNERGDAWMEAPDFERI